MLHSSIRWEPEQLFTLVFSNELKSACGSVWVLSLGAVGDHTKLMNQNWSHWSVDLVLRGQMLRGVDRHT